MSWSVATLTEAPKKASLATPSPPAVTKAPVVGLVDSVTSVCATWSLKVAPWSTCSVPLECTSGVSITRLPLLWTFRRSLDPWRSSNSAASLVFSVIAPPDVTLICWSTLDVNSSCPDPSILKRSCSLWVMTYTLLLGMSVKMEPDTALSWSPTTVTLKSAGTKMPPSTCSGCSATIRGPLPPGSRVSEVSK